MDRTYKQGLKEVYIICGGPSLQGQPLGWLHTKDTIVVNYAAMHISEPTYFITADSGCIRKAVESGFWNLTKNTKKVVVANADEHPCWNNIKEYVPKFDEHVIPTRWDGCISVDGNQFATGKNTGFCALQYAVQLGYKEIYLLGIDLAKKDNKKYFYSDGEGTNSPYDLFYKHYVKGLEILRKNGVKVFSCSEVSRLNKHIPYVPIEKRIPKMPVFVSHYTIDTPYEKIVTKLTNSLDKWNLDYDIDGIESLGSWRANSNYCAWQVQKMLAKHKPRSILRLDADAIVQQYPDLFERKDFNADVAAVIWEQSVLRPGGEFMGGTMYFGNTEATKNIVDEWVMKCEKRPNRRNGDMLWGVIQKKNMKNIQFVRLPLSYCRIYDYQVMGKDKVIVHYQASRRCKRIINIKAKNERTKNEREIVNN